MYLYSLGATTVGGEWDWNQTVYPHLAACKAAVLGLDDPQERVWEGELHPHRASVWAGGSHCVGLPQK